MSRASALVEQAMRKEGFVSASVVCSQYGITRSQLLEVILQGKIRPQKPDNSAVFYCNWSDCLKLYGTPQEYRSRPKKTAAPALDEPLEPEILLDGMIPTGELEDLYKKEAQAKAAAKQASRPASAKPAPETSKVVIRPLPTPTIAPQPVGVGDPDFDLSEE